MAEEDRADYFHRHPGDILRVALATIIFAWAALLALRESTSGLTAHPVSSLVDNPPKICG
ncbi:MAG: hypothetical protein ACUVWR_14970 [Anaerolineae bacterium]